MPQRRSRLLAHWFLLCTALSLTLQCCGAITEPEPYSVGLELPEGEDPYLFWYGVQSRVLRIEREGAPPVDLAWESGGRRDLELRRGDRLEFSGSSEQGLLLVSGRALVGEEKKAAIPLRRVL